MKRSLIALLKKIFEKSPLGCALVQNGIVFHPVVIATTSQKEPKSKLNQTSATPHLVQDCDAIAM